MIDCIAIPTTKLELNSLAVLFACWDIFHRDERISNKLVITLSGGEDDLLRTKINTLIRLFNIQSLFAHVELLFLDIPKDEDIYIKHGSHWHAKIPRMGLKSGPNLQFFRTIYATKDSEYTFLNETDVLPLNPLWLQELSSTLRQGHDWVLGSNYKGDTTLGPDIISHINGAAVYNTGSIEFQDFCRKYWEPGVEEMCRELPDTAYDIWISRLQHKFSTNPISWSNSGTIFQRCFSDAISRFTITNKIANLTLESDFKPLTLLKTQGYSLVHGKHFLLPALANAMHEAHLGKAHSLAKYQYLAIISRFNNSPDIIEALESVLPEKSISLAKKILSQKKLLSEKSTHSKPVNHKVEAKYEKMPQDLPALKHVQPVQLFPKTSDICIFTRSYIGDANLLPEMYKSIEKNFSNVSECVLVVEDGDLESISKIVPTWVRISTEHHFAPGTIQHKYSKLTADEHTKSEWIFHLDSDTLVTTPINENYLLEDGKPIIEITTYESLRTHQDSTDFVNHMRAYVRDNHLPNELEKEGVKNHQAWITDHFDNWFEDWYPRWKYTFGLDVWQEGTSFAFGSPIDLEFSQKPIKLYPREIYPVCRHHIRNIHSMEIADFIKTRVGKQAYKVNRSQYFSDLNFIGACLYYYYHDSVYWVRTDIDGFNTRETYFNQRISYDILKT